MRESRQHEPDSVPSAGVPDVRIVLRSRLGRENDLIVDHPGQPEDYIHTDSTVRIWQKRWHFVHGFRLRSYDLIELPSSVDARRIGSA
jgi:hypothetical protein